MPSDKKPVYIPREKRLHGAFRGGFSAGYFNTVGSREGWTPRQEENIQQRPEDFMDEQDHNEWGGPSAVHAAFQPGKANQSQPTLALLSGDVVPPANVGWQLLRALGWRESSSSAFVPSAKLSTLDADNTEEQLYLSAKRLRKIQLSQIRVEIPQPKLDTAGLGFQRFANAPEFERDREKFRKLQANRRKVYRVADAIGGTPKGSIAPTKEIDEDDHYVSFETEQDFVGSKSVGGFALHEDEDDAYDDEEDISKVTGKVNIDQDNYDNVAYEHQDSTDEEREESLPRKSIGSKGVASVLGSVLSAWASASAPEAGMKKQALTSDGRPVLPGFVLGGTDSSFASSQRFPGPALPDGYEVQPHVFSADDHPLVIQALSHAEKLAASLEQKISVVEDALKANAAVNKPTRLYQKGIFDGVRRDMSSRFVTSTAVMETQNDPVAGLSTAADYEASQALNRSTDRTENESSHTKKISITRTASTFVPEPLLCKRFHVTPPEHTNATVVAQPKEPRTREEVYFQDEILAKVKVAPSHEKAIKWTEPEGHDADGLDVKARPSIEVYKSIYNAADDSPGTTDDENELEETYRTDASNVGRGSTETMYPVEDQVVPYRKRSRTPPRSPSSSDASLSTLSGKRRKRDKKTKKERKERRKSDDRKRKKKHKKSSKRKR
ncbi:G patch domain-containing protein 1 [Fistulifera solaris]|uniref:G patch domain-containing protein 1 n=1 Tax=Fistulifera solaris TaxID=1519565 RepID=A0A1Z5KFZ9_FISSO|nr:G patch domain-containing protein 1 [Fistulifera solaris]|eukprot:GAX25055.1 G patch domain-containing protein 1 [Fistulifera solaris]